MSRSALTALRRAAFNRSAQDYTQAEAAAENAAQRIDGRGPSPTMGRFHGEPAPDDLAPAGGQAIPADTRRPFERTFGRDFSRVRVHSDAQAAEGLSAVAYTIGQQIVAQPGALDTRLPTGRARLAHELAHTLQQAGGAPSLQRDDTPRSGGPGAAPPEAAFTPAEGVALEDGHILFERDSITLGAAARNRLRELIGTRASPLTVEVHGYASGEGSREYNANLSAHRAAAVQSALDGLLPARSAVRLYAHGETTAFGALPQNRRAGVRLLEGVPQDTTTVHLTFPPLTLDFPGRSRPGFSLGRPGDQLRLQPVLPTPTITSLGPSPIQLSPTQSWILPANPGPPRINWPEIIQPFHMHGVRLGERELGSLEANWAFTYNNMLRLGLSQSHAAWIANTGTAYAYNLQLSQDAPTSWDRFQQQDEIYRRQYFPNELRTPIVPIITPGTLNTITRWVFRRDIQFEF